LYGVSGGKFAVAQVPSITSDIPGLVPPDLLIFLRLPKTGGNTMDQVCEHCFPGQWFYPHELVVPSALLIRPTAGIAQKFRQLTREEQRSIRCLIGTHVAMDVDTIFNRPSKFFAIVRHPVDRVISSFFHNRTESHLPSYPFIKDLSLEQYLESGIGLDADNHQVRVLSGCPELDAPWDPHGRPISTPPVEPHHLELAKLNIEQRFIVVAALEQFTALVWFLKRLYGWPLHRVIFRRHNENAGRKTATDEGRPPIERVSTATRLWLTEMNRYDMELYEWVRERFAQQIRPLEPRFSREVRRFEMLNAAAQKLYRTAPDPVRKLTSRVLYTRPAA
jgi:Galactose-3-O-sulfotransferase